ncbi:hypothetical protein [Sulfurimonas sp.]
MDFFLKHKIIIVRTIGIIMLLLGFVIHFWAMPKMLVSENEIAAANVARMEASVKGRTAVAKKIKPDMSHFTKALVSAQQERMRYITIFAMILGVLFLGYSFLKKEEH